MDFFLGLIEAPFKDWPLRIVTLPIHCLFPELPGEFVLLFLVVWVKEYSYIIPLLLIYLDNWGITVFPINSLIICEGWAEVVTNPFSFRKTKKTPEDQGKILRRDVNLSSQVCTNQVVLKGWLKMSPRCGIGESWAHKTSHITELFWLYSSRVNELADSYLYLAVQ